MNKLFVVLVVCVAVFAMSATFALAANPVAAPVDAAQPESFKPFCEVCVVIATSLEKYANESKPKIIDELDKVCDKLGNLDDLCKVVVSLYGDKLVDLIIQKLPPKEACCKLTLCSCVAPPKTMHMFGSQSHKMCKCGICNKMINFMKKESINKKQDKDSLAKLFMNTCNSFTKEQDKEQCFDMLGDLATRIVSYAFTSRISSKDACKELKQC